MKPSEDIELLKEKIKALEIALDKQHHKRSFKAILSGKTAGKTHSTISISLLSKLINSSVDGIIAADKSGGLLVYNQAATEIFGYGIEEALGSLNIRDLYPQNGAFEVMARLRSDGNGGRGKLVGDLVHVLNKSGQRVPVRMNASIVYENGREIATIGYLRDLRMGSPVDGGLSAPISDRVDADADVSLNEYLSGVTQQLQKYDQRFCVGAIKNKLAVIAQVKQALRKQSEIMEKTKVHVPIGRIMIQLGILTETERDAIVSLYRMDPRMQASGAQSHQGPPPLAGSNQTEAESIEKTLSLEVSGDRLEAVVRIDVDRYHFISLEDLLQFIETQGIGFGVVANAEIESYLNSVPMPSEPLLIARGRPSVPEKPPEARLYFSTDPLGVGTAREDGSIDWKNRGKLPQVKSGSLLADVVPGSPGVAGTDVFGNAIAPLAIKPTLPKCGKGVALSEDGTQYLARLSGMAILADNRLSIVEALVVAGDVGLETGHIDFDGHVEVEGSIHEGYRVNCRSLRVEDVHEAEVTVAGDMIATGGIYESTVNCKGTLQVPQIRKSRIQVGGDLLVQKEIMESTIATSGQCLIQDGTIIFSRISAKDGVIAGNLGRKGSQSSILSVGVNEQTNRQIKYTKNKLKLQQRELDQLPDEVHELEQNLKMLEDEKTALSNTLACHMERVDSMHKQLEMLKIGNRDADARKMHKIIDNLNSEKDRIEAHLRSIHNEIEILPGRISQKRMDIQQGQKESIRLEEKLDALIADKATHQQGAMVQVNGIVYAGTTITGPHASLTIADNLSRMIVKEVRRTDEEGGESTVMRVTRLD